MASIAGVGDTIAATASTSDGDGTLPGGGSVPSQAIEAPASVPVPGVIAPSVPDGSADSVVSSASTSGIPAPALAAYQRGAQIIDAADTTCNIGWELIAAIGRVESDHGRYGGNTLTADGVSKPGIYGPELNGKDGTAAIKDTDGGDIDGDPVYDRAVGPMQFIPSTWQVVKVDADGDGKRNPQDIDDASLATAVYLCSGTDNLANRKGQEAAVYRYNHSQSYVDLVLRIMEAYSQGDYTSLPSASYGGTASARAYLSVLPSVRDRTMSEFQKSADEGSTPSKVAATDEATSAGGVAGQTATSAVPPIPVAASTAAPADGSSGSLDSASSSPSGPSDVLPTAAAPTPLNTGTTSSPALQTPSSTPSAVPSPAAPSAPAINPQSATPPAGMPTPPSPYTEPTLQLFAANAFVTDVVEGDVVAVESRMSASRQESSEVVTLKVTRDAANPAVRSWAVEQLAGVFAPGQPQSSSGGSGSRANESTRNFERNSVASNDERLYLKVGDHVVTLLSGGSVPIPKIAACLVRGSNGTYGWPVGAVPNPQWETTFGTGDLDELFPLKTGEHH